MRLLLDDADLKPPEAVFVSPLQRALQTAAVMHFGLPHAQGLLQPKTKRQMRSTTALTLVIYVGKVTGIQKLLLGQRFPHHSRVHVRNLLRERCTGFPCDERCRRGVGIQNKVQD